MSVAIRTSGVGLAVVPSVVSAVHELDANVPVSEIRPMADVIATSTMQRRLIMVLLMIFAAVALLLASLGIYGVISYSVTQRTQEIGIRMALGAQRRDLLRMVVGNAMLLTSAGIALGAIGAYLLTRVMMTNLLFSVTARDPMTFFAVAVVLVSVAALASYVPGRRATRVDPVVALRAE
jgi:putative ABC transport system permease protein